MDGFAILDIVISIAFIYLTYSLLASILVEIIDAVMNLRGRNLRRSIKRMLQDKSHEKGEWWRNFFSKKKTEKQFVKSFFEQPTIKFLRKNSWYQNPTNIEADVFSNTIIDLLLKEQGESDIKKIENAIGYYEGFDTKSSISVSDWSSFQSGFKTTENKKQYLDDWLNMHAKIQTEESIRFSGFSILQLIKELESIPNDDQRYNEILNWKTRLTPTLVIDTETRYHLCLLYRNGKGTVEGFKLELEKWFEEMMVLSSGWYKQWTAKIALIAGLILAVSFNINTLEIGQQLAENEGVRTEMIAQIESKKLEGKKLEDVSDSLGKANEAIMKSFSLSEYPTFHCSDTTWKKETVNGKKVVKKIESSFSMLLMMKALLGWGITALAISFGAPFWFDILNKFMVFKGAIGSKPEPENPESKTP